MITDKDIEILGNNGHFIAFIKEVHARRESAIKELSAADRDSVMKVAGRVDELDKLLDLVKYEATVERYARMSS